MKKDTSWGNVAEWYSSHVAGDDSYHRNVVLPNLLRLLSVEKMMGMKILDLACGSGYFASEFKKAGAEAEGLDISPELIALAKKQYPEVPFGVAPAHKFPEVKSGSVDAITLVLAIQNIREIKETLAECFRALKPKGKMYIVMNHPAFRIPGGSSWGWDPTSPEASSGHVKKEMKMYRRVDEYLTEKMIPIAMHPGSNPSEKTVSFHRPLQYYMKLIGNAGFAVSRMEEWISHRASEAGPRQKEEDRMRKEIPLFLALELVKYS